MNYLLRLHLGSRSLICLFNCHSYVIKENWLLVRVEEKRIPVLVFSSGIPVGQPENESPPLRIPMNGKSPLNGISRIEKNPFVHIFC